MGQDDHVEGAVPEGQTLPQDPQELRGARSAIHQYLLTLGSGNENSIALSNVEEDYMEAAVGELQDGQPDDGG
jgi:hypothetical protein